MNREQLHNHGRMLISCPDQPGIIAAVSDFLYRQGANIIHSDQHTTDPQGGAFFMRVEFHLPHMVEEAPRLEQEFVPIARRFSMTWRVTCAEKPKRMAIFVSKEDHCLLELLWQHRAGELPGEIAMVVSNHENMRELVESYGVPFYHVPVSRESRQEAEAAQIQLLAGRADLVVLARYMQILSPQFIRQYPNCIINIHHSFLPAFVGAKPYSQAYQRGVKLIGATAHYVTEDLDAGPIIEQDVQRVDHRYNVDALKRIGRNIERTVLARAVRWHLEDRILVSENKTVVFS